MRFLLSLSTFDNQLCLLLKCRPPYMMSTWELLKATMVSSKFPTSASLDRKPIRAHTFKGLPLCQRVLRCAFDLWNGIQPPPPRLRNIYTHIYNTLLVISPHIDLRGVEKSQRLKNESQTNRNAKRISISLLCYLCGIFDFSLRFSLMKFVCGRRNPLSKIAFIIAHFVF